jgi:hypothetical protein
MSTKAASACGGSNVIVRMSPETVTLVGWISKKKSSASCVSK